VTNWGTVPIVLKGVRFSGTTAYTSPANFPITIQPGETIPLPVQFNDPGVDGTYTAIMDLDYSPLCDLLSSPVFGIRGGAAATIQPGVMSGKTGEVVTIPIYLRTQKNLTLGGASAISTTLRLNASVLYPLFQPKGVVVNGERFITLTMPFGGIKDDVLGAFPFVVTLGTQDSTTLWLNNSAGVGGYVGVIELPGFFTITNICREGGSRYFTTDRRFALQQNRPNPFNSQTQIDFETIEEGSAKLWVCDRLGRTVATLVDGPLPPGAHSVRFDADRLPSGVYTYVLQTGVGVVVKTMVVMK
jgi:hypothetical protein